MINLSKIKELLKANSYLLSLSAALFLLRSNIPYALYIFAVIQAIILIDIFKTRQFSEITPKFYQTTTSFKPYYLIAVFFLIGVIIKPYGMLVYKDIMNLIILISFIFIFSVKIDTIEQFNKFKSTFLKTFLLLFSAYLLISFLIDLINGDLYSFFFAIKGGYESFDRNMYSLNLWISIISLLYIIKNTDNKKSIIASNIFISLLLLLVLFSSSRRGIVIFSLFSISFIVYEVINFIKKNNYYKKLRILFSLYLLIFIGIIIFTLMPANYRTNFFDNTIDNKELKNEISRTTYRYYRLLKPNNNYKDCKILLWGSDKKNNNTNSKISYQELLKEANKNYQSKNYTTAIDLIQKATEKTDTFEYIFPLLPNDIQKLEFINKQNIKYLPEITKLPYQYTHFFSCLDIKNLFLQNYNKDSNYPFIFSFKTDTAFINLKLPALANSEYQLNFKLISKKDIFNSLLVKNKNLKTSRSINKSGDTTFFQFNIVVPDSKKASQNISLSFYKNKADSFALSNLSWKLVNTSNSENPETIYNKSLKELKKFKFEQNRSKWLWNSYFNAEKLTNTDKQKKYSKNEITKLINNILLKIKTQKYVASKITGKNNIDTIIYQATTSFSRARFNLPIIQNAQYLIEFNYQQHSKNKLVSYMKRLPEIHNVYFSYQMLSDTTLNLSYKQYKKTVKFRVDSINSATALFAFGFQNLKQNDTLIVSNIHLKILNIESDSILLSKAQYEYLKNWAKHKKEQIKKQKKVKQYTQETEQYKNKNYWQIDSSVYKTSFADRLELWLFGWQYFKSLPLSRKIFGDGFNYYKVYKLRFGKKYKYKGNYFPHNPIIAALLYSGIIGAIAYTYFLIMLFIYYYKYSKELGVFVLIFILIILYSFISGKTHFTIPYYVLFSIFPFLIQYIKKYDS